MERKIVSQKLDVRAVGSQPITINMQVQNYETVSDRLPQEMLDLFAFMEKLPHPRVNNLILKAMVVASRKFSTYKEAADWMGVSPRMFTEYISLGKPFSFSGKGEHSLAGLLE